MSGSNGRTSPQTASPRAMDDKEGGALPPLPETQTKEAVAGVGVLRGAGRTITGASTSDMPTRLEVDCAQDVVLDHFGDCAAKVNAFVRQTLVEMVRPRMKPEL